MTGRSEPFQGDAWYAWEEEDTEQSWLLDYVDVLCVNLAMVLVLLVSRLQTETESVTATATAAQLQITEELPPLAEPEIPSRAALDASLQEEGVEIVHDANGMTLQIAEVVLFDSSKARLKDTAEPLLERAVLLLNAFGEVDVAVQGHTDDRPVQGGQYQSNWELASARANAVAAFLLNSGFPPERLRLESYADTRPIADNATDEGRSRNRRVELRVEMTPLASAPVADGYRSDS